MSSANTSSALDSVRGEHYIQGRRAALAGISPSSAPGQPGTLEHDDFARGAQSVIDERGAAANTAVIRQRGCSACHCGGRGHCGDIA